MSSKLSDFLRAEFNLYRDPSIPFADFEQWATIQLLTTLAEVHADCAWAKNLATAMQASYPVNLSEEKVDRIRSEANEALVGFEEYLEGLFDDAATYEAQLRGE